MISLLCILYVDPLCRWTADEEGVCEDLDGLMAMTFAMEAWGDWILSNVDQNKRAFFVTMSPTHLW